MLPQIRENVFYYLIIFPAIYDIQDGIDPIVSQYFLECVAKKNEALERIKGQLTDESIDRNTFITIFVNKVNNE